MHSGWVDPGCKGKILVARATVPSIPGFPAAVALFTEMYRLQHEYETATCKTRVCCVPVKTSQLLVALCGQTQALGLTMRD